MAMVTNTHFPENDLQTHSIQKHSFISLARICFHNFFLSLSSHSVDVDCDMPGMGGESVFADPILKTISIPTMFGPCGVYSSTSGSDI